MLSLSMIVVAIWLQAHYFNMFVYENEIYLGVMFDIGLLREELERTRRNLLKYCELDTLAMVKIWERLKEVSKE